MNNNILRAIRVGLILCLSIVMLNSTVRAQPVCRDSWPAWDAFKGAFMSSDGRIIDPMHADLRTVSEGQAYAAVFALAANDRAAFDRILKWTENNLAQGDLRSNLPAWIWGKLPDNKGWGVLDPNAASDADVWLAYALLEAGRLWQEPRYLRLAEAQMSLIVKKEVMDLPNLGKALIPAPFGFVDHERQQFRLNPSYLAPQPLRRFAEHVGGTLWQAVLASGRRVLIESAPAAVAGDWVTWDPEEGFVYDDKGKGIGSYDAIRVYLWIGMLHEADPDRRALLDHYRPVLELFDDAGRPPEFIDIESRETRGVGPGGFSASYLPFMKAWGKASAVAQQQVHLARGLAKDSTRYYDQVLKLWGLGWMEKRFRFSESGRLIPAWTEGCRAP